MNDKTLKAYVSVEEAIAAGQRQLEQVRLQLRVRVRVMWDWALLTFVVILVSSYVIVEFAQRIMEGGSFLYAAGGAVNVMCAMDCSRKLMRELGEWLTLYLLQRRLRHWLLEVIRERGAQ